MCCPNPGPLNGDIHLDLVFLLALCLTVCVEFCHVGYGVWLYRWLYVFTLMVKGNNSFTHFRFCKVIWDPSGTTCYLNVKYSTSTAVENQNLWNWCCSTANLEKWFFLLAAFQDFSGTLKRDKMILMQRKQFHFDSLNKLLGLKVHKLFLLVTQLELLFGAALRLVHSVSISACSHSNITQNWPQAAKWQNHHHSQTVTN